MRVSLESRPGPAAKAVTEARLNETEAQALKDRAQGQPAANAGGKEEPHAPVPKTGEHDPYSIRNKEEADLVARMKGQGRSPEEILTALNALRAGKGADAGSSQAANQVPGKIDESARPFTEAERRIASVLASERKNVTSLAESENRRNADADVDGVPTEFKTMVPKPGKPIADAATVKNQVND